MKNVQCTGCDFGWLTKNLWRTERWHHLMVQFMGCPPCIWHKAVFLLHYQMVLPSMLRYTWVQLSVASNQRYGGVPTAYVSVYTSSSDKLNIIVRFWWCKRTASKYSHCGHGKNFQASRNLWIRYINHLFFDFANFWLSLPRSAQILHLVYGNVLGFLSSCVLLSQTL